MKTFTKIFLFLTLIVTTSACNGQFSAPEPSPDENPCQPNPCKNSGTCSKDSTSSNSNGYQCTCVNGYTGDTCEKSPCDSYPCQNGGTCGVEKTATNGYKCTCKKGYSGDTCELRSCQTYTASAPACQHNGKCKDDATKGHTCDCTKPYHGEQCELSPCNPNPCQNSGSCKLRSTEADGYICECPPGFDGKRCEQKAFQIKVKTSSANETFEILSDDSSAQFNVDWENNGNRINNYTSLASYTFKTAGDHIISITGNYTIPKFNCSATGKLIEVVDWGTSKWKSMNGAFNGCAELTSVGSTIPDLSNVEDMSKMFYGAIKFDSPMKDWNVSNVINMSDMFHDAKEFNQSLDKWDISRVQNMSHMFDSAINFNQNLKSWETEAILTDVSLNAACTGFALNTPSWTTGKPTKLGTCTP